MKINSDFYSINTNLLHFLLFFLSLFCGSVGAFVTVMDGMRPTPSLSRPSCSRVIFCQHGTLLVPRVLPSTGAVP